METGGGRIAARMRLRTYGHLRHPPSQLLWLQRCGLVGHARESAGVDGGVRGGRLWPRCVARRFLGRLPASRRATEPARPRSRPASPDRARARPGRPDATPAPGHRQAHTAANPERIAARASRGEALPFHRYRAPCGDREAAPAPPVKERDMPLVLTASHQKTLAFLVRAEGHRRRRDREAHHRLAGRQHDDRPETGRSGAVRRFFCRIGRRRRPSQPAFTSVPRRRNTRRARE